MSGGTPDQLDLPQRFEQTGKQPNAGLLRWIGLPLFCLGMAAIVAPPFVGIDPGMAGLIVSFILIFVGCLLLMKSGRARSLANVTIDEAGLIVERGGVVREITWSGLRWAEENTAGGYFYLMLYDQNLKITERIPKSIQGYETLRKLVEARFNERPSGEVAEAYRKRSSGYARSQLCFGVLFVLISGLLILLAQQMPNELPRLNKEGEFGWAEVLELYTSGEDDIPWLKYQVVVDDQYGPTETVRMEPEAWQALKEQSLIDDELYVEVSYLPTDLGVSFARGQEMPSGRYTPTWVYLKSGLALLVGLGMLWSAYRYRGEQAGVRGMA